MYWVKFRPSAWWKATRGIPPEKRGPFMDEVAECVEEDKRGVNPLADSMMDEADVFFESKREAGRLGGLAKARNAKSLARPSTATAHPSNAIALPSGAVAHHSTPVAEVSTPLATPTHNITEHNITDSNTTKVITPITRARARTREDGQAESERDGNRNRNPDPEEQSTIPARIAATRPLEAKAEPSKPTAPSGKSGPFSWADLSEDKQRYVWTIAPAMLPQFAVWFCQEPDNAKAEAVYKKFCARFGAEPFRILLDKFVASVFAGEEPDNRGAAFMASVMAEGRARQAEQSKQKEAKRENV